MRGKEVGYSGKVVDPTVTAERVYEFFDKAGFYIDINYIKSKEGTFSTRCSLYPKSTVSSSDTPLFLATNGKGMTADLAEASGLSELSERFCCLAWLRLYTGAVFDSVLFDLPTNNESNIGLFPSVEQCPLASSVVSSFKQKGWVCDDLKTQRMSDRVWGLSVEGVWDKSIGGYVPLGLAVTDTNGMCAGNTREEALIGGVSELFERLSEGLFCNLGIVAPEIPREVYSAFTFMSVVRKIEASGRYRVEFRDASCGKGLPVVFILVFDCETFSYRWNFGAHPVLELALERCVTELLQNCGSINDVQFVPFQVANFTTNGRGSAINGAVNIPYPMLQSESTSYDCDLSHFYAQAFDGVLSVDGWFTHLRDLAARNGFVTYCTCFSESQNVYKVWFGNGFEAGLAMTLSGITSLSVDEIRLLESCVLNEFTTEVEYLSLYEQCLSKIDQSRLYYLPLERVYSVGVQIPLVLEFASLLTAVVRRDYVGILRIIDIFYSISGLKLSTLYPLVHAVALAQLDGLDISILRDTLVKFFTEDSVDFVTVCLEALAVDSSFESRRALISALLSDSENGGVLREVSQNLAGSGISVASVLQDAYLGKYR